MLATYISAHHRHGENCLCCNFTFLSVQLSISFLCQHRDCGLFRYKKQLVGKRLCGLPSCVSTNTAKIVPVSSLLLQYTPQKVPHVSLKTFSGTLKSVLLNSVFFFFLAAIMPSCHSVTWVHKHCWKLFLCPLKIYPVVSRLQVLKGHLKQWSLALLA